MDKKIILFDWDDTLFSKTKYKKNLRSNLARICEVSEVKIFEFEEQYFNRLVKSDDFKIENFVSSFEQKFSKKIDLEDFSTNKLGIYSQAFFPEIIEVLEKMKNKYVLGIYSQGFESLQKIKIKYSGIEKYFNKNLIFIDRDKTSQNFIKNLPIKSIIIDDKKEVIETLKKLRPDLKLIWINRLNDEKIETSQIRTIKELNDLLAMD
jgi:phosphoglycolate phosphatase-like HAD superfamily hydrolase